MDFMRFAGKVRELKDLKRTGWLDKGVRDPESVADHSFMLALLAYIYSRKLGLDTDKAVRMALLHDICEAYSGDIADRIRDEDQDVPDSGKKRLEEEGLRKLVSFLPEDFANEIFSLWEEFEKRESPEARLVKDLDKLEMCMQALVYSGREGKDKFLEFFEDGKANIKTTEIREAFRKVEADFSSL